MKYHLLPERRTLMQSPRTKPRKSTVGTLYAVGGMDNNKGIKGYLLPYLPYFYFYRNSVSFLFCWGENKNKQANKQQQ